MNPITSIATGTRIIVVIPTITTLLSVLTKSRTFENSLVKLMDTYIKRQYQTLLRTVETERRLVQENVIEKALELSAGAGDEINHFASTCFLQCGQGELENISRLSAVNDDLVMVFRRTVDVDGDAG